MRDPAILKTNPVVLKLGSREAEDMKDCFYANRETPRGYVQKMTYEPYDKVLFFMYEHDAQALEAIAKTARKRLDLENERAKVIARLKAYGPTYTCPHCGGDIDEIVGEAREDR